MNYEDTPKVTLIGASDELSEAVREAFDGHAELVVAEPSAMPEFGQQAGGPPEVPIGKVVLLTLGRLVQNGISMVDALKSRRGDVAFILLCWERDAALGEELAREEVDEVVVLPFAGADLWNKVERYLRTESGRPPESVRGSGRLGSAARFSADDRRHAFRANSVPGYDATALLKVAERELRLAVGNISVENEGWPGGMLLTATEEQTKPLEGLRAGDLVPLTLTLPDFDGTVHAEARIVVPARKLAAGNYGVAIQYHLACPDDFEPVRYFWLGCQRRSLFPPDSD